MKEKKCAYCKHIRDYGCVKFPDGGLDEPMYQCTEESHKYFERDKEKPDESIEAPEFDRWG